MKYNMLVIWLYFFSPVMKSCQINSTERHTDCQRVRKLTIKTENKIINDANFNIAIIADKNIIDSKLYKDSLYHSCLYSVKDSFVTVIFKDQTKEYRIDSVYKDIFDMNQEVEIIFGIDLPPFDVKRYGYSEKILSKNPKEIFYLIVNPYEFGIGRRFIGTTNG